MRRGRGRRRSRTRVVAVAAALVALVSTACTREPAEIPDSTDVPTLVVDIVSTRPHDTTSFTQGLEIDGDRLFEGTGLAGRSRVTSSDPETGRVLASVDLPAPLFGEGLTVAGDTLWQLTWQNGIAIARDPQTLQEVRRVNYDGEGWGLCHRDGSLVMSDGTDTLTFRDPDTFTKTGTVPVTLDGSPVSEINELECTPDGVYANIWKTDEVVRIDPSNGEVTAVIDASALRDSLGDTSQIDVLNGIAAVSGTSRFLMTGKLWPTLFEVEFVPR
ncbi:MAG: glutaminyl-peptide cyclotransferase [Rhodococcus sp. (in: high G+C Gram-positive bacteria)]